MKCLENLSLVDDECLEDLQEDIKKLVESYINVEELCLKEFERVRGKLQTYHINVINSMLRDVDCFWGQPICITGYDGWEKEMRLFFDFNSKEDTEESLVKIMHMFQEYTENDAREFILNNERFWLFRDGANAEAHIEREDIFLDTIKSMIEFEESCVQLRILKYLKKL